MKTFKLPKKSFDTNTTTIGKIYLESISLSFQGEIYEQTKGSPMGSLLSL
jgi:hypothetical protein